ncbi:MAG: DUF4174 domain-containing protein [Rhodobacteraceae bacterium]|nr:DUF4174 domain-containing protein [Paracoccaceae bacterium]
MKQLMTLVFLALAGHSAAAQDADAVQEDVAEQEAVVVLEPIDGTTVTLEDFLWVARPIVVFADTPADPRYQKQMELLLDRPDPLIERDVVILADTDPAANSALREELRPRGFMLVLIAKDGTVSLRKPFPWDVREITHAIDKWPLRQQEIRDANRPRD